MEITSRESKVRDEDQGIKVFELMETRPSYFELREVSSRIHATTHDAIEEMKYQLDNTMYKEKAFVHLTVYKVTK